MKLIKLTVLPLLLFVTILTMVSCEPDEELKKTTDFQKLAIVMTGAQEVPANPSAGIGSMDVFYSKETRILSYKVTWQGLTDSVTAMHIHGLSPVGFSSGIVQNIIAGVGTGTGTSGAQFSAQLVNPGPLRFTKTGAISGTFPVDGVVVKEADLLNGMYYMNIHTKTYGGGEVRGQIKFQ
jgi:CHRD domain